MNSPQFVAILREIMIIRVGILQVQSRKKRYGGDMTSHDQPKLAELNFAAWY